MESAEQANLVGNQTHASSPCQDYLCIHKEGHGLLLPSRHSQTPQIQEDWPLKIGVKEILLSWVH